MDTSSEEVRDTPELDYIPGDLFLPGKPWGRKTMGTDLMVLYPIRYIYDIFISFTPYRVLFIPFHLILYP